MIVFLQNAWSPVYAGASWLRALARSRSGRRLSLMLDSLEVCENTTPIVGATPSSVVPPDEEHVLRLIAEKNPRLIVACGKQAAEALVQLWSGPMLAVPHPAHRLLTDGLYVKARELMREGITARLALRQRKGEVVVESLELIKTRTGPLRTSLFPETIGG